jgi:3-oxoacyl-[acyl-carrier protein] reductase
MKSVLITGATRGIGRATAELFLKEGYKVLFIYSQSTEKAKELSAMGAFGYRADLSKTEEIESVCDKILQEHGGVDVLINNAGVAHFSLATDLTLEDWQRVRTVNLDAPLLLSKAFLPYMIKQKSGRIVNVSSMWGQVGASCEVAYSAAKAGVIGLSKALAKEVGPSGITVNCICPGLIDTEMNGSLDEETVKSIEEETPLCRMGRPEEVAQTCFFFASEKASFITGQVVGVNGGLVIT